jgi:hypothetical protein
MRRLLEECQIGNGNAQLLSEALTFAKPEDLKEKKIIKVRVQSRNIGFHAHAFPGVL